MGFRLSKITTRSGDDGSTGLGNGSRVEKSHLRIHALGEVDELNSQIGLLLTEDMPTSLTATLTVVQHDLFDLGSELAVPGHEALNGGAVVALEAATVQWNKQNAPLKEFILPGGSKQAALAHVARCVCRRAERVVVALAAGPDQEVTEVARQYLNRLSDFLFVIARALNLAAGVNDVLWQPHRVTVEQG